jgi:hypothetical protein
MMLGEGACRTVRHGISDAKGRNAPPAFNVPQFEMATVPSARDRSCRSALSKNHEVS